MRYLYLLTILLLSSSPLYAEQALVLTEIEQIQEKIWYLQRDLASQKDALEKQKGQLTILANQSQAGANDLSGRLATLSQSLTSITEGSTEAEEKLRIISESLVVLTEKVDQKDQTMLEMTGKIGTLEGSLTQLRAELNAQQARHDQALAEIRDQLSQTRSRLDTLTESKKGLDNQTILWAGAAVLAAAILLTAVIAFKGGRRKQADLDNRPPSQHQL